MSDIQPHEYKPNRDADDEAQWSIDPRIQNVLRRCSDDRLRELRAAGHQMLADPAITAEVRAMVIEEIAFKDALIVKRMGEG